MPVRRAQVLVLCAGGAALAGCVVQDPTAPIMCFDTADCDDGETCYDDRVCYGNPPAIPLMVEIAPPPDRLDLAPTEDAFTPSGPEFQASFATPIEVSGRVVLGNDPSQPVPAQVVFRRPSRIPGAADYVVTVESHMGVGPEGPSFTARLLPTQPGETYSVTIFPDDSVDVDSGETVAERAPPYRQIGFTFDADAPGIVFPLGGQSGAGAAKTISGRVLDALQRPVTGLGVRAYGRFGPLDPVEVASSRGATDAEGNFKIYVPVSWDDQFELRLTPLAGEALPTIVVRKVVAPDPPAASTTDLDFALGDLVLPSYPREVKFQVPVQGQAPQGGVEAAVGARVTLRTVLVSDIDHEITYETQGVADSNGFADVLLIPGTAGENRVYTYDLVPAAGTPHRSEWNLTLEVGPQNGVVGAGVTLARRVRFTGTLVDHQGLAAAGVAVRLAPSLRFSYEVLTGVAFDLTRVQFPAGITDPDGRFSLWVDPELLGIQAGYTIEFEPPEGSLLPRWATDEIIPAPDLTGGQELGGLWLPDAAYVRATVLSDIHEVVPAAHIRIYQVVEDQSVCSLYEPGDCVVPAILRAEGTADESGHIRIVLPRL